MPATHVANNVYYTIRKHKGLVFIYACMCSPAISTWIKAIDNHIYTSWPGLTESTVRKLPL